MPKPNKPKAQPKAQPKNQPAAEGQKEGSQPLSGMAAAGNVVACVGVGGLLGAGADWALATAPWGLILGLFLGFAAWLRELWLLLNTR
ncbi:MAG: AtpZ/AtpI family protein [Pseudomonadota bacterium]